MTTDQNICLQITQHIVRLGIFCTLNEFQRQWISRNVINDDYFCISKGIYHILPVQLSSSYPPSIVSLNSHGLVHWLALSSFIVIHGVCDYGW